MTVETGLRSLLTWLQSNNITWHQDIVDIRGGDNGTAPFAIFAKQSIVGNESLCKIPKDVVLSVKNTKIADIIEAEQLGGGLGLILAIMFEYSIGDKSKWYGYLQSLPKREYLPLFWTDAELALLTGTELAGKAAADRAYTQEDWETHLLPLVQQSKYPQLSSPALTLDLFRVAASWVGSRAFGVDSYHGMAMVPLADLFNHKAAVVQLAGDYAVEDVCFDDGTFTEEENDEAEAAHGASDQSDHDDDDDDDDDEGGGSVHLLGLQEQEGEQLLQPMTLEADRGPSTRGAMLDPSLQMDPKLRLEIGICGTTQPDGTEALEIAAASPLEAGKEIFNTYGEHGNAELVNKYGFALAHNPFDAVRLDKLNLVALAKQKNGSKACKRRYKFLDDHSHLLEEEEEPFEVLPGGNINPSLLMTLRVLFADSKQFGAWQNLDDALPVETSASAAFVPVAAALQNPSKPPQATATLHKRPAAANRHESPPPHPKRQKLHGEAEQASNTTLEASCTSVATEQHAKPTIDLQQDNTQKRAPQLGSATHQAKEDDEGTSSVNEDDEEADESLGDDSDAGGQLGNVSIADSSKEVMSDVMLHALKDAIQHRLKQYATPSTAGDQKALKEAQTAALRQHSEALQAQQAAYQLLLGEKNILYEADRAVHAALEVRAASQADES